MIALALLAIAGLGSAALFYDWLDRTAGEALASEYPGWVP